MLTLNSPKMRPSAKYLILRPEQWQIWNVLSVSQNFCQKTSINRYLLCINHYSPEHLLHTNIPSHSINRGTFEELGLPYFFLGIAIFDFCFILLNLSKMLGKEIVINVLAQTKLSHESPLACVLNLSKMPPQYPGLQDQWHFSFLPYYDNDKITT